MYTSVKELFTIYLAFLKIGAFMFGGGYSMLPLLTRELVDKYGWVTEDELLDYFAIAQCTPGIIAVNTATFVGQKRRGLPGGAIATLGVITVPIALILLIASVLIGLWREPLLTHAFAGVRVAVSALILSAVVRMVRASVKNLFGIALAVLSFVLVGLLNLSPVLAVVIAAAAGLVYARLMP